MAEKKAVNIDEMCKMLGISRAVGYQLAARENFPKIKIGRRILVPISALDIYLLRESGIGQAEKGAAAEK